MDILVDKRTMQFKNMFCALCELNLNSFSLNFGTIRFWQAQLMSGTEWIKCPVLLHLSKVGLPHSTLSVGGENLIMHLLFLANFI
jgi:hypothetical protein